MTTSFPPIKRLYKLGYSCSGARFLSDSTLSYLVIINLLNSIYNLLFPSVYIYVDFNLCSLQHLLLFIQNKNNMTKNWRCIQLRQFPRFFAYHWLLIDNIKKEICGLVEIIKQWWYNDMLRTCRYKVLTRIAFFSYAVNAKLYLFLKPQII